MNFDEVLQKRRSIRSYQSVPVEKEKWLALVQAGALAPSSGNLQNWKFIIVEDFEKRKKISHLSHDQVWMQQAPIHIVVCADTKVAHQYYGVRGERLYSVQNCAAALQNMSLAAVDMGLGSCWVSAFDEERLKNLLSIPGDARPQAIFTVGYPNEKVPTPSQKDPVDYLYFETYGDEIEPFIRSIRRRNYRDINKRAFDQAASFFKELKEKFVIYYHKLLK
jgi:nitroreductase